MFHTLQRINERPAPFSRSTVKGLWTTPHIARQMLGYHLDGTVDVASRRTTFIDESVVWIAATFDLRPGTRVVDLGRGPGLYTNRLARTGAAVTGVDFCRNSLDHARAVAGQDGLTVAYVEADYLAWEPNERFDLVTLIMCDFCALGPTQRAALLARVARYLEPGGALVLDAYSLVALEAKVEEARYAPGLMGGFWSADPYFGFLNSFRYDVERVTLDKYTIVEETGNSEYLNWLQYCTPARLEEELSVAGCSVEALLGDVAGRPFDPGATEMAVVARKPLHP